VRALAYRRRGNAENFAHVLGGELLEITQDENRTVRIVQLTQRSEHALGNALLVEEVVRRHASVAARAQGRRIARREGLEEDHGSSAASPAAHEDLVDGNSKEPRREPRLTLKGGDASIGLYERVLRDLFGVRRVAAHSKRESVDALLETLHDLDERSPLSVLGASYESRVRPDRLPFDASLDHDAEGICKHRTATNIEESKRSTDASVRKLCAEAKMSRS